MSSEAPRPSRIALSRISPLPILALSAALAAAACSSGGSLTPAGTTGVSSSIQTDVGGQAVSFSRWEDLYVRKDTLEGDPDDLYRQAVQVYADMEIPITTVDAEERVVGAVEKRIRRELAGQRISRYLRCGSNLSGEIADRYDVWITVASRVEPVEGGAAVLTHVQAVASQGQVSGHRVRGTTEGRLEREIFHRLQLRAAGVS